MGTTNRLMYLLDWDITINYKDVTGYSHHWADFHEFNRRTKKKLPILEARAACTN